MKWRKFIAQEWLIVLFLVGLALLVTFISYKAGVLKEPAFVSLQEYDTKYFGDQILAIRNVDYNHKLILLYYLKKPWSPTTKPWGYAFAVVGDPTTVSLGEGWEVWGYQEREIPVSEATEKDTYFNLVQLSTKEEISNIDFVEIQLPERNIMRYFTYMLIGLPIAYMGVWLVRSLMWSVRQLRGRVE